LALRGRHTLVVGCSGAGKGSMLWGIAAGLGPAVHADVVRLWGIDLKRGVELGIGQGLFHVTADTRATAMDVLAELLAVIDARGTAMVGRSRLHQPMAGDPLHVLVIDELAALTAYADPDTRRDASRLLSEVLTQGRALGVVVVAMVQDPRKETVSMRGLFTQTVALRLRSPEETRMVLGDGMAALAPAHRISPASPGTGYVVGDDGMVDLVRADWWSDELVRQAAETYPAAIPVAPAGEPTSEVADVAAPVAISDRPRKPRSPRASRKLAPVVLEDQVAP
jgi:S-DNA-T family DNA segregation ATPase FtsK/SpoIIIE